MIETLHELVRASGVERMNLSIQAESDERCAVVVQCVLGAAPANQSPEQQALRNALATPICIKGVKGEVDAKLDTILTEYVRTVRPHADSLETDAPKKAARVAEAGSATGKDDAAKAAPSEDQASTEDADSFTNDEATSL